MGLFTELRRSITRIWGQTEQAVGEAYGNEALEYEGEADEAKADAEETADESRDRPDDGTAGSPAR